jgi:hypothetical protein
MEKVENFCSGMNHSIVKRRAIRNVTECAEQAAVADCIDKLGKKQFFC